MTETKTKEKPFDRFDRLTASKLRVQKQKRTLMGTVVSNRMADTVVVKVTRKHAHPLYKKIVSKSKKYSAHCTQDVEVGDSVKIQQTRPISKRKCWRVVEVLKK